MILFVTGHGIGNQVQALPAVVKAKKKYGDIKVFVSGCNVEISKIMFGTVAEVVTNPDGATAQILAAPCQDHPILGIEVISNRTIESMTECSEVMCNLLAVDERISDDEFHPPEIDLQVKSHPDAPDIVLCDGYNKTLRDRWEAKSWAGYEELADRLVREGYSVGAIGSYDENIVGAIDMTGLSFMESLEVVKGSKMLVANDTGIYHAANLIGVKNLAMFTFTDPVKNYDKRFHKDTTIVRLDLDCSPCMKGIGGDAVWVEKKPVCGWRCREVPAEEVFYKVYNKIEGSMIQIREKGFNENVAAYIQTLDEGPFLEQAIYGIAPWVAKVYVVECMTTWSGAEVKRRGLTKEIVDKCGFDNVEYVENPVGKTGDTPAECETAQRQWALDMIRDAGYEWVWWVDADELYRPGDVEALWKWFSKHDLENALGARATWWTYWRSMKWAVNPPEPYHPTIILRSSCKLKEIRVMSQEDEVRMLNVPPDVCMVHHFSWAKRPEEARKKISCWGHADQLVPNWYEEKFEGWKPFGEAENLHPTVPEHYKGLIRKDIPWDHPWTDMEVIEDVSIKVIILHHNNPENTDKLYAELSTAFDSVEVWDSGSDPHQIPKSITHTFGNIYWEGAWQEAMRSYSDFDVVWILGCDIKLKSTAERCRQAIESSFPFGCWSPVIDGRAHPFMLEEHYKRKRQGVKNVEGMALAVSGKLLSKLGDFEVKTKIGFGQDYWLCAMARREKMRNYIDGRVAVIHPASIGYDESEAHDKMEKAFSAKYGANFRQSLFEYSESYEGNLMEYCDACHGAATSSNPSDYCEKHKPGNEVFESIEHGLNEALEYSKKNLEKRMKIVTVDNGWGVKEFEAITSRFKDCQRVILAKGVSNFEGETTAEVIPYADENAPASIMDADIALFTRVGAANAEEYQRFLAAGIPVVVNVQYSQNKINHEKNGFIYGNVEWAVTWIEKLIADEGLRLRIGGVAAKDYAEKSKPEPKPKKKDVKVSIITPTYRRDPAVISRCIDCVRIQTVENIEQLVCSDGEWEGNAASVVDDKRDKRISYTNTHGKKPGDFGNVVRQTMLEKASGEYILFMDDDNIILPNYLEKMIAAIEESGKDFAVCRVVHFGPLRGDAVGDAPQVLRGIPVKLHYVDPLQILVKREAMLDIGWDTEKGYLADGHTLEVLGEKYDFVEVPEVLGFHM